MAGGWNRRPGEAFARPPVVEGELTPEGRRRRLARLIARGAFRAARGAKDELSEEEADVMEGG